MAHRHGHGADNGQSDSKAYETRDVKLRPLLVFAAGLAVTCVAVYLVIFVLFRLFSAEAEREDARLAPSSVSRPAAEPGAVRLPPEPRIQANAAADMKTLRQRDEAILTTYGWVDRQAGVARIPIDVAMKQVLEEGLPVRQPDSAPPAAGTPATPGVVPPPASSGVGAPRAPAVQPRVETPRGETKKAEK